MAKVMVTKDNTIVIGPLPRNLTFITDDAIVYSDIEYKRIIRYDVDMEKTLNQTKLIKDNRYRKIDF
jgi:hypothetical protein